MKNIEIKKVASAKEAVAIINRLNYMSCTFGYRFSTFSNDYATEYRHFDTDDAFAIEEIVQGGKLVAVRFYNLYRDIIVELQLDNVATDEYFYGKFNIINVDAEIEAEEKLAEVEAYKQEIAREERIAAGQKAVADHINACMEEEVKKFEAEVKAMLAKKKAETDGSEDDSDDEEAFSLLPEISKLNDIGENENEPTVTVIPTHEDEPELTAEQIQKLIDATIAERTEAIDAIAEAEADEEISQTHIDYLKGYIDELLDEYNDLCKQLDAAKAKASADETGGSESDNLPAPEGQPTVQAVAEQLAEINSTAPEGLEIYYDAETKKFPVVSYGGEFPEIYYELDSLALYKILTPEEFWTRIKRGCSTDEEMIEWLENSIAQARGQRADFAADENPDLELLSWYDFEIADREGELAALKAKMSDIG